MNTKLKKDIQEHPVKVFRNILITGDLLSLIPQCRESAVKKYGANMGNFMDVQSEYVGVVGNNK